jgi:aldehyde:ferredoxin oxidoreductase
MEREFNLAAGLTCKDDNLPPRLMNEAARTGSQKGATSKLNIMLPEYYRVRGWSPEGVPTTETRARLGV